MKSFTIFLVLFLSLHKCYAQPADLGIQNQASIADLPPTPVENGLFDTDDILQITLNGSIGKLLNNRAGKPKTYPLVLSYAQEDGSVFSMPVEVKTRGHFRRMKGNCTYPPLMIQFPNEGPHLSTIFKEQHKLKLVMPCDEDSYIVREWLVYELYNLVTPKSFEARLVKVSLIDADKKKNSTPFYGMLLEEEKQMAARNQMVSVKRKLKPMQTQKDVFLNMAVFEYLIGNTDWSVQYQQNIKLLATDTSAVPFTIPYDFDHSGIVNAPYARPAEELQLESIRERRYRGYCVQNIQRFEAVIENYNRLKSDIYRLYTECALLDGKYVKSTLAFLDEFYATIYNPEDWQKAFTYPCDPGGTGNVVIKGLRED